MNTKNYFERFILICVTLGIVFSCLLLMGANIANPTGRYQLQVVVRNSFPDLYVIDTSTGRVKWVDSKNENKPFEAIK